MSSPKVSPGDEIAIGAPSKYPSLRAIVCTVSASHVEVVYTSNSGRPVAEDVIWDGQHWQFKSSTPNATYADLHERFSPFVAKLLRH